MPDLNPYATSSPRREPSRTQAPLALSFTVAVGAPLLINFAVLIATGNTDTFFRLLQQAAPWLIFAWPLTAPLLLWLHYAANDAWTRDQLNSLSLLWIVPLIITPIAMLTWGAVFAHPRGVGFMRWHLIPLQWAFYSTFLFAALCVLFNKGRRGFVASLSGLLIVFSFFCSFTAGSSVTGDWL